jgi:ABC-type sugar transport system permease subunit
VGYGSSIAVVLFLITFAVSGMQFWLRTRGEKVEY